MTATSFTHTALPGRVVFGAGLSRSSLVEEVDRLGFTRIMLIATEREAELARELVQPLEDRVALVFDNVAPHVPSTVAAAARKAASECGVDGLLCVGGGSTTGTAKVVALVTGVPILAVPTTYAGSEMTPVWGMTTDGRKETGRDLAVLPVCVIYDPELVRTLPRQLAVASAMNAMAHCVEALWTPAANPVTNLMAVEGASALAKGLRATDEGEASEALLFGAYLAGSSFAAAGSGLHHKICHVLGGAFDLPHAETHAVVLPQVTAFNAPALPAEMRALSHALGAGDAVAGLRALYAEADAPQSLKQLGVTPEQLAEAIDLVAERLPLANPRPVSRQDLADILTAAYSGEASSTW